MSSLVDLSGWRQRRSDPDEGAGPLARLRILARDLPGMRSETRALAAAAELLDLYGRLDEAGRLEFFRLLRDDFDPDPQALTAAARAYAEDPGPANLERLTRLSEPPRQELLRRLNAAPDGTARLVALRADLIRAMQAGEEMSRVDADLRHLLRSWFNRGFLMLERIDWSSPAALLEKLIEYEAVHEINGFEDLRRRVLPPDRRCYAYLHPAMPDDPLIFVEVALMRGLPGSVQAIMADSRTPIQAEETDTAVFYSISNCQAGLAGISFGNLLIKNVVAELRRDLPQLDCFVTLSPIPGLRRWLERRAAAGDGQAAAVIARDAPVDAEDAGAMALAARYLLV
ncbi:MAG TPA: malonyl-CoA decarboxylase family protein, partial [Paracoccus sp. (in: a-proteobacteria)]|nr:malonyl-CoA decarboxylase family protein [Paracoccus sp. (in: a-proteobacteria)]